MVGIGEEFENEVKKSKSFACMKFSNNKKSLFSAMCVELCKLGSN